MNGSELREIRIRKGITTQVLADLIGAGDGKAIYKMERMDRIPEYYEETVREVLMNDPGPKPRGPVRTSSGVRFQ